MLFRSPEWVAMQYATERGIPVRFIDKPIGLLFGEKEAAAETPTPTEHTPLHPARRDPIGYAAKAAGYTDSERWWENLVETHENPTDIFDAVMEMMRYLRTEAAADGSDDPIDERRREAAMRNGIRTAQKEMYGSIAVVCGAWHAPVLQDVATVKAAADNALLKGIKKVPTAASWIQWTYGRIAANSGYGAGIYSPAWYRFLYDHPENPTAYWMATAATLLRREGLDASAANVVEATRLANTLATMRGQHQPATAELTEAALTVLGGGFGANKAATSNQRTDTTNALFELIWDKLIIGDALGEVPPDVPTLPIVKDLEEEIKRLKLKPYRETPEQTALALDLRKPLDLDRSRFLHTLLLLHIAWGKATRGDVKNPKGSFHEDWKMQWQPEFALALLEAATWGNTVRSAAIAHTQQTLRDIETSGNGALQTLVATLKRVLLADLHEVQAQILAALQNRAALTHDLAHLLDALPPLVDIARYGDVRQTATAQVSALVRGLVPRIAVALPAATVGLDDDAARAVFERLTAVHRAISVFNEAETTAFWRDALYAIGDISTDAHHTPTNVATVVAHPLLAGVAVRVLFDAQALTEAQTAARVGFALSRSTSPLEAGAWVEGFLYGSGALLLHHDTLWHLLDTWLDGISREAFEELLPMLHRAFSTFSTPEKRKMLQKAIQPPAAHLIGTPTTAAFTTIYDPHEAEEVLAGLRLVLG